MNISQSNQRRNFLKNIATLGTTVMMAPQTLPALPQGTTTNGDGFTFLFQGDSITDGNRSRNNDWNHVMGHGFAYLIASRLWYDFPKRGFHFFNRGVSGNKVPDLATRWHTDTIDIKPDVLNILVGINDADALLHGDKHFTTNQFEQDYRQLLQQTKQALPNTQLVLCEPFILPVGRIKERWEEYAKEMTQRRAIAKKLSKEFNTICVEFQTAFDKALSKAPAEYWIWDGIHPMPAGHELMAREWIKVVGKRFNLFK